MIKIGVPAVAKTLVKLWIPVPGLSQELGDATADWFANVIGEKYLPDDFSTQAKVELLFKEQSIKITDTLQPLFKNIDDGDCQAAIHAFVETLNLTDFTEEFLFKHYLKVTPVELANYLIESRPPSTQSLKEGDPAYELYKRMIDESSDYILGIVCELPDFHEKALVELFQNQADFSKQFDKVGERLERIEKLVQQQNTDSQSADFESQYLKALAFKFNRVQLLGAETSTKRYELSLAYITLNVRRRLQWQTHQTQDFLKRDFQFREQEQLRHIEMSVEKALNQSQRLLVRGQAGSGKTTLLQWVAVKAAQKCFDEPLSSWNTLVPFLIKLRNCSDHQLPSEKDFPIQELDVLRSPPPEGWVEKCLKDGRGIIMIDGIDEVAKDRRDDVREWLAALSFKYPLARILVTSRPHAVQDGWIQSEGFDEASLEHMSLTDIKKFICHWHHSVKEEMQSPADVKALQDAEDRLLKSITTNFRLRHLATTPLLCAMICALNRDLEAEVPENRITLYKSCLWMLYRREELRKLPVEMSYPKLRYEEQCVLLEEIAYWMLLNHDTDPDSSSIMADISDIDGVIENKLPALPSRLQKHTPQAIRQYLVERSTLLREPLIGKVDFVHRTFQDFLAAKNVLKGRHIQNLSQQAHNDLWKDTVIFTAGRGEPEQREKLIRLLIKRGDQEETCRYHLYLLAIACLEVSTELKPELRQTVKQRLQTILPPNDEEEAKIIAGAGELALPYLKWSEMHFGFQAVACVQALAQIGGEEALEILKTYRVEQRQNVVRELLEASHAFDLESYGQQIIKPLKIEKLFLNRIEQFDAIGYLQSLKELQVGNYGSSLGIQDLTPISSLSQLQTLQLEYLGNVSDLTPISSLSQLQTLQLRLLNNVSDLTPISSLSQLQTLQLRLLNNVSDLTPISSLSQLQTLQLIDLNVSDLTPISSLSQLQTLQLIDLNVSDLTPISSLSQLQTLQLIDLNVKGLQLTQTGYRSQIAHV